MIINRDNYISIDEANRDFSEVARMVDEKGVVYILKDNVPRYIIISGTDTQDRKYVDDAKLKEISDEILEKYRKAYEMLAKS